MSLILPMLTNGGGGGVGSVVVEQATDYIFTSSNLATYDVTRTGVPDFSGRFLVALANAASSNNRFVGSWSVDIDTIGTSATDASARYDAGTDKLVGIIGDFEDTSGSSITSRYTYTGGNINEHHAALITLSGVTTGYIDRDTAVVASDSADLTVSEIKGGITIVAFTTKDPAHDLFIYDEASNDIKAYESWAFGENITAAYGYRIAEEDGNYTYTVFDSDNGGQMAAVAVHYR